MFAAYPQNPHMLPKLRSEDLMSAIGGKFPGYRTSPMPCTARISSFIPGHRCASRETVVGAHLGSLGKGISTKVSDLMVCAACLHCHDLIDGRDSRIDWIIENHPQAFVKRIVNAITETQLMLVTHEIITVKGGTLQ